MPPFTIFLGDVKTMYLKALCGLYSPLDLTSCTEIKVQLPMADGSFSALLLSAGKVAITSPAVLGKFTVPIGADVSALLNVGALQSFDVTFTIAGAIQTVRYNQALSVFEVR